MFLLTSLLLRLRTLLCILIADVERFTGVLMFGAICSFNASIIFIDFEAGFSVYITVGNERERETLTFLFCMRVGVR